MPKRNKITAMRLTEISLTKTPANRMSTVDLRKSKGGVSKAAQTSEVRGHRHAVGVRGADGNLELYLEDAYLDGNEANEPHRHDVVKTREGWRVVEVEGHVHSLPSVRSVVERLIGRTDGGEPPSTASKRKAPGLNVDSLVITKSTKGHSHVLDLDASGNVITLPSGSGGEPHTHTVTKGADGSYVLGEVSGHTHELGGSGDLLSRLKKASGFDFQKVLRNQSQTKGKTMSKQMSKRLDAEEKLNKLASECAADLGISFEQAFSKVLDTEEGAKLYDQHAYSPPMSKAESELEAWVEEQIETRLAKSGGRWDSIEETALKRRKIGLEIYRSDEYARKYQQVFSGPPQPEPPEPELAAVSAGLLTKSECEADPEGALDRLAIMEAHRLGITPERAMAGFFDKSSVGYDLLLKANAAQDARSASAMGGQS